MNSKPVLIGMTLDEIAQACKTFEIPGYAIRELALWIYKRGANDIEQLTNISKKNRNALAEGFDLGLTPPTKVSVSNDGTKKYLFPAGTSGYIETAYIPDGKRNTLCISSQIGCKLGCEFCMTGRQGFQGQLSVNQILNQFLSLPEKELITNIVFMGMGEPFNNTDALMKSLDILTSDYGMQLSSRKITVSTVGIIPGMCRFIEETNCQLAISLHNPFNDERSEIMPVEKAYPIENVIQVLKEYHFKKYRRLSFEYIVFKGINDTPRHVNQLARVLNGLRCRINLIRFHSIPDSSFTSTDEKTIQDFQRRLNNKGIVTTIRASRGEDIMAACGLLSTKAYT